MIRHGEAYLLKIGEWLKIGKVQMELKRIVFDKPEKETKSLDSKEQLTGQEM